MRRVTIQVSTSEPNIQQVMCFIIDRFRAVGCSPSFAGWLAGEMVSRELLTQFAVAGFDMRLDPLLDEANNLIDQLAEVLEATDLMHEAIRSRLRALSIALYAISGIIVINVIHLFL